MWLIETVNFNVIVNSKIWFENLDIRAQLLILVVNALGKDLKTSSQKH